MNNIKTRRSIRKYADTEVSETLIKELLQLSERTQTMGNLQLYSVVETRDPEMKRQLALAHFSQPMVMEAPVVLTFCADFHRTTVWAENRQATPGYGNLLSFLNAATDTLLYCQTFCNLAEERGLGLCFLGTTIYQPQQIIDLLKLPKLVFPIATITVGWPAEEPPQSDRLPLEAILHQEMYKDYEPQDIDTYYSHKEQLPENKHIVEINHKQTLAQVFTDLRYTKKDNEAMSKTLLTALLGQGF